MKRPIPPRVPGIIYGTISFVFVVFLVTGAILQSYFEIFVFYAWSYSLLITICIAFLVDHIVLTLPVGKLYLEQNKAYEEQLKDYEAQISLRALAEYQVDEEDKKKREIRVQKRMKQIQMGVE